MRKFRIVERLALRECGTLPTVHVSSQKARQQNVLEQENILEMVQRNSTTTSTRRLSALLGASRTRVWVLRISPTASAKPTLTGQCHASRILSLVAY